MPKSDSKQLRQTLAESGLADASQLRGCTEEEVCILEQKSSHRLPAVYREFLKSVGWSAGNFLVGTDMFYPEVLSFRGAAERLLKQNNANYALSSNAFVFLMHQGYQFLFFHLEDNDDPPVFHYIEPNKSPVRVSEKFSAWLDQCIEDEAKLAKVLGRNSRDGQINSVTPLSSRERNRDG